MSETLDYAEAPSVHNRTATSSGGRDDDSIFRVPLESGLLLLAIKFAEPILFEPGFYSQLNFHPFWIVILLAAMHYGLFGGVVAAGLASLLMDWPPRPLGVDIAQHYTEMAIQPLHWLVVALAIGSYRSLQIRESRRLQAELARTRDVNEKLAEEITRMDTALAHAELAFVTQEADHSRTLPVIGGLLDILHSSGSNEEMADAFARASEAATTLPAALLMLDPAGNFVEATSSGALDGLPLPLSKSNPLVDRARLEPRSAVVPRKDVGAGKSGFLTISGVHLGDDAALAGIVVLVAEDEDDAAFAQDVAEMLAIATSTALHGIAPEKSFEGSNVRVLPTGSK